MSYTIPKNCIQCGICLPECPTGAIQIDEKHEYWVEPALCNNCEDKNWNPLCVTSCPEHLPQPLPTKKGRYKAEPRPLDPHPLFPNGHTNPIATSMVIWEACNILAKGSAVSWQTDKHDQLYFQRPVKQGKGKIDFWLTNDLVADDPEILSSIEALPTVETMDLRAACLHLIFAAYAVAIEHPWEQEFTIDNKQIERYLGLDKRKDLSKATKLSLIKSLVQQPCKLLTAIDWPQQGKIQSFSVAKDRIWHLMAIENHFQEDAKGYKHLVGMTFKIKAGAWAEYFLNKQGYKKSVAFYQYGTLPKFVLQ
ncbi:MAG: 4Fe-4S binding protein, partial [Halothece sp. Uz-M2-17]|nr:4Fe-4S binding protein [Halothece sp. Uz-M2-17]